MQETRCASCSQPLREGSAFCGECGASRILGTPTQKIALDIDASTIKLFAAQSRCLLRLRLRTPSAGSVDSAVLRCELTGEGPLEAVQVHGLASGKEEVVSLFAIPRMSGYTELKGTLEVADGAGSRRNYSFSGINLVISAQQQAPRVSVVNIDQSNARVVDNSNAEFASGGEHGSGLVSTNYQWQTIELISLTTDRKADSDGAAKPAPKPGPTPAPVLSAGTASPPASPPADDSLASTKGAPVNFVVMCEDGASYRARTLHAFGELATLYEGVADSDATPVVIKISNDRADNDLLYAESRALRLLRQEESPQHKHLPRVLGEFRTPDGRNGTVLERIDGLDLVEVLRRLPSGMPASHLVWLMRRCLSVLGWAHAHGVLHGNLDPAHILVRPKDHNVWVIDWCYSLIEPRRTGQGFRVLNDEYSAPEVRTKMAPLPSADIYSLGKCIMFVAGGDPTAKTIPVEVDTRLAGFIRFLTTENVRGRPHDAWAMYRELDSLRGIIWGSHTFEEFIV